jgi:hypothetical protein
VSSPEVHGTSASGKTFAVEGTSGDEQGVFAIAFPSGAASFLEGGRLVAVTDTHVYFVAADGLCDIPLP